MKACSGRALLAHAAPIGDVEAMSPEIVKPSTCPLDCPDRCALDVHVDGEKIMKIDGSKRLPLTNGFICAKVRDFGGRVDSPLRILHPMRRTGPKGSGRYERATWDEAIAAVAGRFRAVVAEHGPQAILPYSYSGSNGLLTSHAVDEHFWNRLGASKLERTLCAANTGAGWTSVLGEMPSSDPAELQHSDCIVLWSVNPSVTGIHFVPLVREARKRGAFVAVIDPRRTPLAKQANLHIPLYPGTDVAAALAMIAQCERESLLDRAFLDRHARGLDRLLDAARPWTLERAAALGRVSVEALAALPRAIAAARAPFFRVGWGLERNRNGADAVRAVVALRLLFGRFEPEGAGIALSTSRGFGFPLDQLDGASLRRGAARTINMSRIAHALDHETSPPIDALFIYNANPVATAPHQSAIVNSLRRESLFTVVHEQVWTDSCDFADWVLPATTFLEHHELNRSYGGYALQWAEPAIAPRGEARSNHAVFTALAAAMGFDDPSFARSEIDTARDAVGAMRGAPVPWDRLQREHCVPIEAARPFANRFPPRGYADLAGAAPPTFRPAPFEAELPIALISPSSSRAISSTLFETLPAGDAVLTLSVDDAARRGIRTGDRVRARNRLAALEVKAEVSPDLPVGVAALPKGLWRNATLNGWTANALIPDHVDELGGGACYNDARVEVERIGDA